MVDKASSLDYKMVWLSTVNYGVRGLDSSMRDTSASLSNLEFCLQTFRSLPHNLSRHVQCSNVRITILFS